MSKLVQAGMNKAAAIKSIANGLSRGLISLSLRVRYKLKGQVLNPKYDILMKY